MTPPAAPAKGTSRGAWWYAGVGLLIATAAVTAFVFYFGGYSYLLSGDSASFTVEWVLAEIHVHPEAKVVVLGNSTAAEGFRPNWFRSHGSGDVGLNLGVPSGWFFLYQRLFETALNRGVRPKSAVVMLTPESIATTDFDFLLNDLAMLKTIVDTGDLVRLAPYAATPVQYMDYAETVVGRPILFRAELRDFVTHPIGRLREAKHIHDWVRSFTTAAPMVETDNKFDVCQAGDLRQLDQTMAKLQAENSPLMPAFERLKNSYTGRTHQDLKLDPHKMELLRQLLAEIEARHVNAFVTEAPFWDPSFEMYPEAYRRELSAAVRMIVASVPGATYLPKVDVDCSMMLDAVHLNRKGGEIFTEYLRTRVL